MVRSDNKQLAINIFSNICIYVLQFVISFLLTPFIVKALGVEAYGFVGLSNNIISYTTLITVALIDFFCVVIAYIILHIRLLLHSRQ